MRAIALSALVVLIAGCSFRGDDEEKSAVERSDYVVALDDWSTEEAEEGLGAVGLTARGSRTLVSIEVEDPKAPRQQAEIRQGNCQVIGGAIVYSLQAVVDGRSATVVNETLRELRRSYMVLVHDVPRETRVSGICGDLSRARPPGAVPIFE